MKETRLRDEEGGKEREARIEGKNSELCAIRAAREVSFKPLVNIRGEQWR